MDSPEQIEKVKIQYYAVVELTPSPFGGDDYRVLVIRDNKEDAMKILKVLKETDIDYTLYKLYQGSSSYGWKEVI